MKSNSSKDTKQNTELATSILKNPCYRYFWGQGRVPNLETLDTHRNTNVDARKDLKIWYDGIFTDMYGI